MKENFGGDNINNTSSENKPEKKAGVSRVVTNNPELEKKGLEFLEDIFENKQIVEGSPEREKTEKELAIIRQINEKLKPFVEEYGGEFIEVKPQNIHILDPGKMKKEWWKELRKRISESVRGITFSLDQRVSMFLIRGEDDYSFAKVLAHEFMHFNSFRSFGVSYKNGEGIGIHERRMGLAIAEGDEKRAGNYLGNINEAITEELAIRFAEKFFPDFPELSKGIKIREEISEKSNNEKTDFSNIIVRIFKRKGLFHARINEAKVYVEERNHLKGLIREIYLKNSQKFDSEEDVFKVFARAFFSGKILELVGLIDKSFGRGYFVKMAKETFEPRSKRIINF